MVALRRPVSTWTARVVRSAVLAIRQELYVAAALARLQFAAADPLASHLLQRIAGYVIVPKESIAAAGASG